MLGSRGGRGAVAGAGAAPTAPLHACGCGASAERDLFASACHLPWPCARVQRTCGEDLLYSNCQLLPTHPNSSIHSLTYPNHPHTKPPTHPLTYFNHPPTKPPTHPRAPAPPKPHLQSLASGTRPPAALTGIHCVEGYRGLGQVVQEVLWRARGGGGGGGGGGSGVSWTEGSSSAAACHAQPRPLLQHQPRGATSTCPLRAATWVRSCMGRMGAKGRRAEAMSTEKTLPEGSRGGYEGHVSGGR